MKEKIIRANYLYRKEKFAEAISLYKEVILEDNNFEKIFKFNIDICNKKIEKIKSKNKFKDIHNDIIDNNAPLAGGGSYGVTKQQPFQIYITMTSIDSRLEKVKFVMESLTKQTYKPYKIILNVSKEPYLLDKGVDENNSIIREIQLYENVVINWVPNIGPYRKIYPFLERHFSQSASKEKIFITVDDDTIYPDYFVKELLNKYLETKCIVAFRGRCIEIESEKISKYDKWSMGKDSINFGNLPTGKDGIIYSTNFFTPEFLDLKVIKEIAPTVDDLWIKWHCALNGIKSQILNPEACLSDYKSFPVVDFSNEYRGNSLYAKLNSKKAGGNNDIAIEKLEDYFLKKYGYNLKFLLDQEVKEANYGLR